MAASENPGPGNLLGLWTKDCCLSRLWISGPNHTSWHLDHEQHCRRLRAQYRQGICSISRHCKRLLRGSSKLVLFGGRSGLSITPTLRYSTNRMPKNCRRHNRLDPAPPTLNTLHVSKKNQHHSSTSYPQFTRKSSEGRRVEETEAEGRRDEETKRRRAGRIDRLGTCFFLGLQDWSTP